MNFDPNIWFPSRNILYYYALREKELGDDIKKSKYKVLREARSVALFLLGVMKLRGRDYWLQLVDPKERTPDIRTATKKKWKNKCRLFF